MAREVVRSTVRLPPATEEAANGNQIQIYSMLFVG